MSMAKPSLDIITLLGKRIWRIVGCIDGNHVEASAILFDDERTYIQLEPQDEYTYHDCCHDARVLTVGEDPEQWRRFASLNNAAELT